MSRDGSEKTFCRREKEEEEEEEEEKGFFSWRAKGWGGGKRLFWSERNVVQSPILPLNYDYVVPTTLSARLQQLLPMELHTCTTDLIRKKEAHSVCFLLLILI